MGEPSHLPGYEWFRGMRNPVLRAGAYSGAGLSLGFTAWLLVANRVPMLEHVAGLRNAVATGFLGVLALVPVWCFLRQPGRLFFSGIVAWGIFGLSYRILLFIFPRLEARMGAFHFFILGAVAYAGLATVCWVTFLVLDVRREHATKAARRSTLHF